MNVEERGGAVCGIVLHPVQTWFLLLCGFVSTWLDLVLQARVDVNIILSSAQASLVRNGDHSNDELRLRNMDTHKRK